MTLNSLHSSAQQVVPLYPGKPPGSESWTHQEAENNNNAWNTRIVYNVSTPTLTVITPDAAKANGTAVVIFPGGGFHALSIDVEGFDVAKWLATRGVTAFVLKYRLVPSKTADPVTEMSAKGAQMETDVKAVVPLAMADGLNSVRHVREHAKEYGINPSRIGIIGFSAGGTVAASVAYNYNAASRPDFAAPIYLQYTWAPRKDVPADAPPLFLLAATNDELGLAPHSVEMYQHWTAAGKPAELHLYQKGGHGFGMRTQNLPTDKWIERFGDWLAMQGLMKP